MQRKRHIPSFFTRLGNSGDYLPDYVYEQAQQIIKRLESGAQFQSINRKKCVLISHGFVFQLVENIVYVPPAEK